MPTPSESCSTAPPASEDAPLTGLRPSPTRRCSRSVHVGDGRGRAGAKSPWARTPVERTADARWYASPLNRSKRLVAVGRRRPESEMTLPRSVAEGLGEPVTLEVECIDRMYLNLYQPRLQHELGVVGFFKA